MSKIKVITGHSSKGLSSASKDSQDKANEWLEESGTEVTSIATSTSEIKVGDDTYATHIITIAYKERK
jgi:hypothetical protein